MNNRIAYTPSKRLYGILGLMALMGLGVFWVEELALVWLVSMAFLVAGIVSDRVLLGRCRIEQVKHAFNHQPTVHRPFHLTLDLKTRIPQICAFTLDAVQSDALEPSRVRGETEVLAPGGLQVQWELTPKKRGKLAWPGALAHVRSALHLVDQWQTLPEVPIKVYPKLNSNIAEHLNPNMLLEQMGVKSHRFLRADQIFDSLRPYLTGDNYRHIDWKASARVNTLVTRQFQMEHHHNILVCLDSSRLMGTLTQGISKLDWAIEATLHLAYLSNYFKDKIGLLVFSNAVEKWVKPLNHPVEMFLQTVYDVESKVVESDLNQVCANILATQKKRSLVIFLSDFLDAGSLQPCLNSFAHLNKKHCTLFIGIEDPAYRKHLENFDADSAMAVSQRIVAQNSMDRRLMVMQQLRQMGLKALTVSPENLVQRAMNAYLEIKLQGAI